MIIPFESKTKGKCCDCEKTDTLDAMVRKDNEKGIYHCKDCETEDLKPNYFDTDFTNKELQANQSRIRRLFAWCFG